jgi:predicted PurR-regulated permease PerM
VGQPHSDQEGPIAHAESLAARQQSAEQPLGRPGRPFDRQSWFYIGLTASAGVAVTYTAVRGLASAFPMLVLMVAAFFIALGLEPAAEQARQFVELAPQYIPQVQHKSSWVGRLNERFHLQQRITDATQGGGGSALGHVIKASAAVFGALADSLIVGVLTVYFLVDMPRVRATLYRLFPNSRRPRAILLGDQIYAKVGAYVVGNVLISLIAGAATFVWLVIFHVPYPLLLAIFVALLDLVPFGSAVAGAIVAAVALTVSVPVSLATLAFYMVFRLAEDYFLVPKIIGRAVRVPAVTTLLAVLLGGALLGVVGALLAIPIAAAIQLIAQAVVFPRLDEQ